MLLYFQSKTSRGRQCHFYKLMRSKRTRTVPNLVGLIVGQAAAKVGVAPSEGLAPGGRNQNFVLLHCQDALVSAHDLSHWLLQL